MLFLYVFSLASAVSTIGVLTLSDIDRSEKVATALIFALVSLLLLLLGRLCGKIAAQESAADRSDDP